MTYPTPYFDAPADGGAAAPAAPAADAPQDAPEASAPAPSVELNDYGTPRRSAERKPQDRPRSGREATKAPPNALEEAAKAAAPSERAAEQPRDESGKFASKETSEAGTVPTQADAPASEVPGDASEATPTEAETKADEAPSFDDGAKLLAEVRKAAPGLAVTKAEDLPAAVSDLQEEVTTLRPFREVIEAVHAKSPQAVAFLDDLANGTSELVALRTHFPDLARDIEEGDAEFADWKARQAEEKVRTEFQKKEEQRREQQRERWANDSKAAYEEFKARAAEEYPGLDAGAFEQEYLALFSPEHGRRFRGDHFDIIARGLHHETLTAQAVEQARAEERQKVLAEVRQGKHAPGPAGTEEPAVPQRAQGDLPPNATGAGGHAGIDPSTLSPKEQRAHQWGQALFPGHRINDYGTPVPLTRSRN